MTPETLAWCGYVAFLAACAGGLSWSARPIAARDALDGGGFSSFATMELRRGLSRVLAVVSLAFVVVAANRALRAADGVLVAVVGACALAVAWLAWHRPD